MYTVFCYQRSARVMQSLDAVQLWYAAFTIAVSRDVHCRLTHASNYIIRDIVHCALGLPPKHKLSREVV